MNLQLVCNNFKKDNYFNDVFYSYLRYFNVNSRNSNEDNNFNNLNNNLIIKLLASTLHNKEIWFLVALRDSQFITKTKNLSVFVFASIMIYFEIVKSKNDGFENKLKDFIKKESSIIKTHESFSSALKENYKNSLIEDILNLLPNLIIFFEIIEEQENNSKEDNFLTENFIFSCWFELILFKDINAKISTSVLDKAIETVSHEYKEILIYTFKSNFLNKEKVCKILTNKSYLKTYVLRDCIEPKYINQSIYDYFRNL